MPFHYQCARCAKPFETVRQRKGQHVYCSHQCWAETKSARQIEGFWSRAKRSETTSCIVWTGAIFTVGGYGRFKWKGKEWKAHRLAWTLTVGEIPSGLLVLHKCDNPPCVNIEHLFLGTHQDNSDDCISKGREGRGAARGEASGRAKLTEQQVIAIRRAHANGQSLKSLGEQFGVSSVSIYLICARINWKHVIEPI